jgi:hypothetical protein
MGRNGKGNSAPNRNAFIFADRVEILKADNVKNLLPKKLKKILNACKP